jgi:hypothetical protein
MGESLMQQRRVSEEGFWIVKLFRLGRRAMELIPALFDGTRRRSTG